MMPGLQTCPPPSACNIELDIDHSIWREGREASFWPACINEEACLIAVARGNAHISVKTVDLMEYVHVYAL